MINAKDINNIQKVLNNKKIIYSKILSKSFGINCIKISTSDGNNYIVKYYNNLNLNFNSIKSETDNLNYLNNLNISSFPKVIYSNNNYLIISYINNNELKPEETNEDLIKAITDIHTFSRNTYGFEFSTQIGGLEQYNQISKNWVEFYREKRLGYIFDLISNSYAMDISINKKIEKLISKLENFIPKKPKASLLHGDMWEGNILFQNKKFAGFIDPGSFYGHNELEVSYLTWFNPNFIKNGFLDKYNEIITLDKEYKNYEPVYQLYYSLLNVHLWDRKYISDVKRLLKKINI